MHVPHTHACMHACMKSYICNGIQAHSYPDILWSIYNMPSKWNSNTHKICSPHSKLRWHPASYLQELWSLGSQSVDQRVVNMTESFKVSFELCKTWWESNLQWHGVPNELMVHRCWKQVDPWTCGFWVSAACMRICSQVISTNEN